MSAYSFEQLELAYIKIYENAVELSKESAILKQYGALARSYALLQFACEELGKLPYISDVARQLIFKEKVDWAKFNSNLRSHGPKNDMHQLLSFSITKIIKNEEKNYTKVLNTNKNGSLYVDFYKDTFLKPKEYINKEMLDSLEQHFALIFISVKEVGFHKKGTMKEMLTNKNVKLIMNLFR